MAYTTAGACLDTSLDAAVASAHELMAIWGDDRDQIEAHLESEGFPFATIDQAMLIAGAPY